MMGMMLERCHFEKQDYLYTPMFCEENIWQLCKALTAQHVPVEQLKVLLLSNARKQIVVFNQQFAHPGLPLVYDYHVILKYQPYHEAALVFDFDTFLPFPCDWYSYQQASFPAPASLYDEEQMMVREIPAEEYLACFNSDRSHMAHLPAAEHPPYPCIQASDPTCTIDLKEYWQLDQTIGGSSNVYAYLSPSE